MKLFDGWLGEKDGMSMWPPVFLSDITNYFIAHGDVGTIDQSLKDAKIGKAFEYFVSGWLKEVFLHTLTVRTLTVPVAFSVQNAVHRRD